MEVMTVNNQVGVESNNAIKETNMESSKTINKELIKNINATSITDVDSIHKGRVVVEGSYYGVRFQVTEFTKVKVNVLGIDGEDSEDFDGLVEVLEWMGYLSEGCCERAKK